MGLSAPRRRSWVEGCGDRGSDRLPRGAVYLFMKWTRRGYEGFKLPAAEESREVSEVTEMIRCAFEG
jgi:hypothetical protein